MLESELFQPSFAMWPDPALSFRLSYWLEASLGPGEGRGREGLVGVAWSDLLWAVLCV